MTDPAEPTTPHSPHPESGVPPVPPAPWAAPGAAPFGPPAGQVAPAGAHAPSQGYALPAGYAAPGATAGQPQSVPPYGAAPYAGAPAAPRDPGGRGPGITALVLSLVATVGAALAVAIAAFDIGLGTGREITMRPMDADFDWSVLTPVRDQVLLGEVAFWLGTALGVWALVQGVIAIVRNRGRGAGIAAVVIATLGPIVFFVALWGFFTAGLAAGAGIGG